jgi:hypothetical protein
MNIGNVAGAVELIGVVLMSLDYAIGAKKLKRLDQTLSERLQGLRQRLAGSTVASALRSLNDADWAELIVELFMPLVLILLGILVAWLSIRFDAKQWPSVLQWIGGFFFLAGIAAVFWAAKSWGLFLAIAIPLALIDSFRVTVRMAAITLARAPKGTTGTVGLLLVLAGALATLLFSG